MVNGFNAASGSPVTTTLIKAGMLPYSVKNCIGKALTRKAGSLSPRQFYQSPAMIKEKNT